jgi:hypothetical protein
MALQDQNLVLSSNQAVTATAASTNAYDIEQGALVTTTFTPSPNQIIGNATYFGEDLGLGRGVGTPVIEVFTGSGTPAAATSLQVAAQGAPMNNTAFGSGNVSDLTFTPYAETGAIPLASILSSIRLCALDLPRRQVGQALPRFLNLNYIVVGSNFTGLTLTAYINLGGTSAQSSLGQYPSNY